MELGEVGREGAVEQGEGLGDAQLDAGQLGGATVPETRGSSSTIGMGL